MAAILIVEDDALICELAGMMIHDFGHHIVLASDVDEGLAILRSSQKFDALFTDIYLKRAIFGGCDLAQQARQLRPSLRVLYTTGNAITDSLKSVFVQGSQFLRKPYTSGQLQASIDSLLAA
jgi:CheY-like chemotaxis protein